MSDGAITEVWDIPTWAFPMAEIERLEARRRPEDFHRACVVNVPCFFPVSVKTGRAKKTDWVDVFENDDTYIYICNPVELHGIGGSCIIGGFKKSALYDQKFI
jgi:hypothetical protein